MTSAPTSVFFACSWTEAALGPLDFEVVRLNFLYDRLHYLNIVDGEPILASASSAGHIALWDLNAGGRLLHLIRGAHDGAISALEWVPGQPVLITSGEDNSVKVCKYITTFLKFPHSRDSNGYLIHRRRRLGC
jgi:WD40 repeat protein